MWIIVSIILLLFIAYTCAAAGISGLSKNPNLQPRHYQHGTVVITPGVVGIPSWQYPPCVLASQHYGPCKDANNIVSPYLHSGRGSAVNTPNELRELFEFHQIVRKE